MYRVNEEPIVIYVLGYGRSGSTLLDRLLGCIPGCLSCGEIFWLWQSILDDRALCSCHRAVSKCSFWETVAKQVFRGDNSSDVKDFADLFYSMVNKGNIIPLFKPGIRSRGFKRKLENVKDVVQRLYRAIMQASGARIIVDSSKLPYLGVVLSELEGVDLRMVHLVRDSRAVVYSNIRKRWVSQIGYTATQNPLKTMLAWNLHNFLAERCRKRSKSFFVRVRYEDLVFQPKQVLGRLLLALGLSQGLQFDREDPLRNFRGERVVYLGTGHILAGNAFRFVSGPVEIKPDTAWKKELSFAYKLGTTLVTAPLLKKYQYSLEWA